MGSFHELGEVGIGKGTECNILSVCQMLDTNMTFKYEESRAELLVVTDRAERILCVHPPPKV